MVTLLGFIHGFTSKPLRASLDSKQYMYLVKKIKKYLSLEWSQTKISSTDLKTLNHLVQYKLFSTTRKQSSMAFIEWSHTRV